MLPPNQMMPAPAYPMTDQKHSNAAVMPQKFWIKTFARPSGVRRRLLEMQYSH